MISVARIDGESWKTSPRDMARERTNEADENTMYS